jgi:hypothetical protein
MLKSFAACLIALFLLSACDSRKPSEQKTASLDTLATVVADTVAEKVKEEKTKPEENIPADAAVNELSRVIAGMSVEESSPYFKLTQTAAWKKYAHTMDSSWSKLDKGRLTKMRTWRETELKDISDERELFYPFSGPDFVHAYNFFNRTKVMHMFGLEGVGSLPDVSKRSEKDMANYYASIQNYLREVMEKSYFITKKMLRNLYQVNGMTPILCTFIVRAGNTVQSIQPMRLDTNGTMIPLDTTRLTAKQKANFKAVKITYEDGESKQIKSIIYYSGDLADYAFKEGSPIYKYLYNMPQNCNGLLKSASYLLYGMNFTKVRNAMLDRCSNILQDDTGVGYRFYDKKAWNFIYYGVYDKPIGDFPWAEQKDLRKAFKDSTSDVRPLPFGIGYHWYNRKDNLILARKR